MALTDSVGNVQLIRECVVKHHASSSLITTLAVRIARSGKGAPDRSFNMATSSGNDLALNILISISSVVAIQWGMKRNLEVG